MPELPEVEITKQGIMPCLLNQTIVQAIVRKPQLRLPVTPKLAELCVGKSIVHISRRAKYLLIELSQGYFLIHLGMSGHLRILKSPTPADKHDHIELHLSNGIILRYYDPRRFGLWLYLENNPLADPLLSRLGLEPLAKECDGDYLYRQARNRKQNIKSFLMNQAIVVGIGNIYAAESLFLAQIHPQTPAHSISQARMQKLAICIKQVLQQAIEAGGTTLRDFYAANGKPGYFAHALKVYGRKERKCYICGTKIETITIGGRNSAFCPKCQT